MLERRSSRTAIHRRMRPGLPTGFRDRAGGGQRSAPAYPGHVFFFVVRPLWIVVPGMDPALRPPSSRRIQGGILAMAGWLLSPLTPWNDIVVNLPLAMAFAWVVSLAWPEAYTFTVLVGYLVSNVAGLLMLHLGARRALGSAQPRPYTRRDLVRSLALALAYTVLVMLLVHFGVLQPLGGYLGKGPEAR